MSHGARFGAGFEPFPTALSPQNPRPGYRESPTRGTLLAVEKPLLTTSIPRPVPGRAANRSAKWLASAARLNDSGEMAERSKAHAWKACVGQPTVGSNPTLSAIWFARGDTIARTEREFTDCGRNHGAWGNWISGAPRRILGEVRGLGARVFALDDFRREKCRRDPIAHELLVQAFDPRALLDQGRPRREATAAPRPFPSGEADPLIPARPFRS